MATGDDKAQERAHLIVRNAKVTTLQDRGSASQKDGARRIPAMRATGDPVTVWHHGGEEGSR